MHKWPIIGSLAALVACHAVGDVTGWQFEAEGSSAQGGAAGCEVGHCPDAAGDCQVAVCLGAMCGFKAADERTICSVDGGKVCNAVGDCVECLDMGDCAVNETCPNGYCAGVDCMDTLQNGAETDVDCGGDMCSPCANGADCSGDADCLSHWCTGNTCEPCANHDDCGSSEYCDAGACKAQKEKDAPCQDDNECQSDCCKNSVCASYGACE